MKFKYIYTTFVVIALAIGAFFALWYSGASHTPSLLFAFVQLLFLAVGVGVGSIKEFYDAKDRKQAEKRVFEAEDALIKISAKDLEAHIADDKEHQGKGDRTKPELNRLLGTATLFDLYNKQITNYQLQTQSRAYWSFLWAVLSMLAGLFIMIWGGWNIVSGKAIDHVLSGSVISAIGGAVSAFITKTFLDVHRVLQNKSLPGQTGHNKKRARGLFLRGVAL